MTRPAYTADVGAHLEASAQRQLDGQVHMLSAWRIDAINLDAARAEMYSRAARLLHKRGDLEGASREQVMTAWCSAWSR